MTLFPTDRFTTTVTVHRGRDLIERSTTSHPDIGAAEDAARNMLRGHGAAARLRFRSRALTASPKTQIRVEVTDPYGWVSDVFILYVSRHGEVYESRIEHNLAAGPVHHSVQGTDWTDASAPTLPLTALVKAAALDS